MEFLKRHKNKLLLVGGAAGVVVVINKILSSYEKQWQTSSSRRFVHEVRKKEIHFENIINECNQICQRMSPKIINRLRELLDDTQLIQDLTNKRSDSSAQSNLETWKLLKVKILTRLISEIYCTCLLVCYMRVQMSVIGGQVFAKSGSSSASVADLTDMKAYTKYIALLGSFYDNRFDCLIEPVEEAVDETLRGYSIDYKVCIQDFKTILEKVKNSIKFFLAGNNPSMRVFLKADELSTLDLSAASLGSGPLSESDEKILRDMLAETQDILESEDFKHVLDSSIDVGYAVLLDTLLGAFIQLETKLGGENDKPGFSNPNSIKVPLGRILHKIRKNQSQRSETEQKMLTNHLLCLDVLNCFAANIYEAFCEHNEV